MKFGKPALSLALALIASTASFAAEPVTTGLVLPMSGPFADCGKQIERGMRLHLAGFCMTPAAFDSVANLPDPGKQL